MYKIEKGIPVGVVSTKNKYPFDQMEVGDSFYVKGDQKKKVAVGVAVTYYKKFHANKKFTCRTSSEGIRVWRTA